LLTIEKENGIRTMRISEWLKEDPVSLDIVRRAMSLKVNKEVFDILISKLRALHPKYFKDALGLKTRIKFKGYDKPVQAIVPYSTNPVEFYKWWSTNETCVNLTLVEKIKLFDKVFMKKPEILKSKHKKMINKK
jgi:hypothetical protein